MTENGSPETVDNADNVAAAEQAGQLAAHNTPPALLICTSSMAR